MKIITFIEEYKVIKKILDWRGIYDFEGKRLPSKSLRIPESLMNIL